MNNPKVLVIGAGIGGIATAARLARNGYQVTVVEKNEIPGGRCGQMVKNGHRFDTGPTLFLMPQLYEQTFADLGERMEDHLDLQRVDPTYQIHFKDGTRLSLTSDLHLMQEQLEAIEPGSFGAYLRYLSEGHRNYHLSLTNLVERDFRSPLEFFTLKNLLLVFKIKALHKHYANMGNYFNDHRLKTAFTFQDMYMGLSPFDAPALYSMMQYTEFAHGVWFPIGGMYRVIETLSNIAEKWGVEFTYNSPVKRINIEGSRVAGVTLVNGVNLAADIVVANADLPYVYQELLPQDDSVDKFEKLRYGCSALIFTWGLDKQYPQLSTHNLFLAGDTRQSYDPIFKQFTLPDDPSFYVHAPLRIDPSLAPKGHDTLVVALPLGHINRSLNQDWHDIQRRARRIVIDRLKEVGASDLEDHIQFEVKFTPHDWRDRYNLVKGTTHGLSHELLQMAYFRPHNRHSRYRNLYFVGASTHPGTGLPTVLVSARLASQRIFDELGIPKVVPGLTATPVMQNN
jgi:phytoene desaturase